MTKITRLEEDFVPPVCRMCWMGTLSAEQQERVRAETPTMPIHYCVEHQKIIDNMLTSFGWDHILIMGSATGRILHHVPEPQFTRVGHMDEKGIERA